MATYRLLIEYDGSAFHGWQIQPGHPTIQEALESALFVACGEHVGVTGSGRTDAGVHARGQVAHFKLWQPVDPYRLRRQLNGILGSGVVVLEVRKTREDFHARYGARQRRYHYYVSTEPRVLDRHMRLHVKPAPDFERMNEAARLLLGRHDFSSFCQTSSQTVNRFCTVREAEWRAEARPGDWHFAIAADRFLHGMVRSVVGTLLQVGHGKRDVESLREIVSSRDRRAAGPAAPAHGLVLEEVRYEDD